MKIKIITVGEPKGHFKNIFQEYLKRLSAFVKIEVVHLKEDYKNPEKVEERVLKKTEKSFLILLDEKGKEFSSIELATFLDQKENQAIGEISFFIGGPNGHSDEIKEKADYLLSFSKMTFPHDLAMVILAESLYRSFSILKNHPYHRD